MKFWRICLMILAGAGPALADTNLFSDGTWVVDGATAPFTNASPITITVDKEPVGAYSELKFYYNFEGANLVQVFSINGQGVFRPSLPPPGVAGGAYQLGGYWDCEQGWLGPLAVTGLDFRSKGKGKGLLEVRGSLSNSNSLNGEKLVLKFYPVEADLVRLDVQCQLVATRDFCVDMNQHEQEEEFHAVTMLANYISPTEQENDLARYSKVKSKVCGGIYGCSTKRETYCINLTNQPAGYLVDNSRHMGDSRLLLAHTTPSPRNTPSLSVLFKSPSRGRIKPQGILVPTDDPALENVRLWGNWVDAKQSYKAKRKVLRLRCTLEATPPKEPNCDTFQEPATPAP